MPKINHMALDENIGTGYPAPFDVPCLTKRSRDISGAAGLTQFGARTYTLPPGAWSS